MASVKLAFEFAGQMSKELETTVPEFLGATKKPPRGEA